MPFHLNVYRPFCLVFFSITSILAVIHIKKHICKEHTVKQLIYNIQRETQPARGGSRHQK